jgi:hypothetical protein
MVRIKQKKKKKKSHSKSRGSNRHRSSFVGQCLPTGTSSFGRPARHNANDLPTADNDSDDTIDRGGGYGGEREPWGGHSGSNDSDEDEEDEDEEDDESESDDGHSEAMYHGFDERFARTPRTAKRQQQHHHHHHQDPHSHSHPPRKGELGDGGGTHYSSKPSVRNPLLRRGRHKAVIRLDEIGFKAELSVSINQGKRHRRPRRHSFALPLPPAAPPAPPLPGRRRRASFICCCC